MCTVLLDPNLIFKVVNTVVLLPWFMLLFLPNAATTLRYVRSGVFSLVLSCVYLFCFVTAQTQARDPSAGFSTLVEVMALFKSDWGVLTGWVHYLAFDLLVGVGIVARFEKHGLTKLVYRTPALFFTLMLGPVGYLVSEVLVRLFGSAEAPEKAK